MARRRVINRPPLRLPACLDWQAVVGLRLVHGHHATESHVEDMQRHGDVLVDARAHIHAVGTPVGYDDAVRVLLAHIRRYDGDHARDVDRPRDGHRHNNRRGRAEVVKHDLRGLHDGLGYRMLRTKNQPLVSALSLAQHVLVEAHIAVSRLELLVAHHLLDIFVLGASAIMVG
uniref:Uncharacterized protein n=1 Tax=Siphoviridae sp. ctZi05 TaxID=2826385 RepID=A0A8S5N135_9CAUD|nr:MAG TPA: hypothetical protein [Siphoviridae sp. ctZi05]